MSRSVHGILAASLIVLFAEAVLSCEPVAGGSAAAMHDAALATIRFYHLPALILGVGVLALFLLRRFKGIVIALFAIAALAISPGWSESAATLGPDCEPIGAFGVKVVLGVVAVCFLGQLAFWIVERRQKKSV